MQRDVDCMYQESTKLNDYSSNICQKKSDPIQTKKDSPDSNFLQEQPDFENIKQSQNSDNSRIFYEKEINEELNQTTEIKQLSKPYDNIYNQSLASNSQFKQDCIVAQQTIDFEDNFDEENLLKSDSVCNFQKSPLIIKDKSQIITNISNLQATIQNNNSDSIILFSNINKSFLGNSIPNLIGYFNQPELNDRSQRAQLQKREHESALTSLRSSVQTKIDIYSSNNQAQNGLIQSQTKSSNSNYNKKYKILKDQSLQDERSNPLNAENTSIQQQRSFSEELEDDELLVRLDNSHQCSNDSRLLDSKKSDFYASNLIKYFLEKSSFESSNINSSTISNNNESQLFLGKVNAKVFLNERQYREYLDCEGQAIPSTKSNQTFEAKFQNCDFNYDIHNQCFILTMNSNLIFSNEGNLSVIDIFAASSMNIDSLEIISCCFNQNYLKFSRTNEPSLNNKIILLQSTKAASQNVYGNEMLQAYFLDNLKEKILQICQLKNDQQELTSQFSDKDKLQSDMRLHYNLEEQNFQKCVRNKDENVEKQKLNDELLLESQLTVYQRNNQQMEMKQSNQQEYSRLIQSQIDSGELGKEQKSIECGEESVRKKYKDQRGYNKDSFGDDSFRNGAINKLMFDPYHMDNITEETSQQIKEASSLKMNSQERNKIPIQIFDGLSIFKSIEKQNDDISLEMALKNDQKMSSTNRVNIIYSNNNQQYLLKREFVDEDQTSTKMQKTKEFKVFQEHRNIQKSSINIHTNENVKLEEAKLQSNVQQNKLKIFNGTVRTEEEQESIRFLGTFNEKQFIMKKYGQNSNAGQRRRVFFSSDFRFFCWKGLNKPEIKRMIPLSKFENYIILGRNSDNFQRFKTNDTSEVSFSFSLVTKERTIDLEAASIQDKEDFIKGLQIIFRAFL